MTDDPIRVIGGSPTDDETAAVAALFTRLMLERAATSAPLPAEQRRNAWQRSTRRRRQPLGGDWRDA